MGTYVHSTVECIFFMISSCHSWHLSLVILPLPFLEPLESPVLLCNGRSWMGCLVCRGANPVAGRRAGHWIGVWCQVQHWFWALLRKRKIHSRVELFSCPVTFKVRSHVFLSMGVSPMILPFVVALGPRFHQIEISAPKWHCNIRVKLFVPSLHVVALDWFHCSVLFGPWSFWGNGNFWQVVGDVCIPRLRPTIPQAYWRRKTWLYDCYQYQIF